MAAPFGKPGGTGRSAYKPEARTTTVAKTIRPCHDGKPRLSSLAMRWLERIERRFGWLAFPGLFKYLLILSVLVYACQWMRPELAPMLDFDRSKILQGQIWRIFTFPLAPIGGYSFTPIGMLLLFFAVRIGFMISDSLEEIWGATRLTLYILLAWAGLAAAHFIFRIDLPMSGALIYTSLFFAFATCFPRVQFMMFFVIPMEVRWLGWIGAGLLAFACLGTPAMLLLVAPALLPYALWLLPDIVRGRKTLADAAVRRRKFQVAQMDEREPFHRCETCGRTERDSPDLEFRVLPDGKEYCAEHLP